MKKYLLFTLFGLAIIFLLGAGGWMLNRPGCRAFGVSKNIEIESEMKKPFWGPVSYKGNWEEAPDGIKHIAMQTHLIKDFLKAEDRYFLGYRYEVKLQPQEQKRSKEERLEDHLVCAYGVDFDFYFLDDDGYCLWKLGTAKTKKQESLWEGYFIFVEEGRGEFEREGFKGYGQAIITEVFIPHDVARRTKKIVYWPTFCPNMWAPLDQSHQTAIGSSST